MEKMINIPPILDESLRHMGVDLPPYVFEKRAIRKSFFGTVFNFFLILVRVLVKIRLRIVGSSYIHYHATPDHKEIERIYDREAETYKIKHHKTTNFRDTWWRRGVAFDAINFCESVKTPLILLDIGTGMGLSMEEILRIAKFTGRSIKAVGIDYNKKMLERAEQITFKHMREENLIQEKEREAELYRADARNLTGISSRESGLHYFSKNFFDCVTIICGIGGINMPLNAFREALSVLKPGGVLIMLDIHQPLFHMPEHWPWFIREKFGALFSFLGWEEITKPLVLGTLWGWRDPTQYFYTSRFVVWHDPEDKKYYGFEKLHFSITNESWWFGLPVITTAKIVLKKIEIEKSEFEKMNRLFSL